MILYAYNYNVLLMYVLLYAQFIRKTQENKVQYRNKCDNTEHEIEVRRLTSSEHFWY